MNEQAHNLTYPALTMMSKQQQTLWDLHFKASQNGNKERMNQLYRKIRHKERWFKRLEDMVEKVL